MPRIQGEIVIHRPVDVVFDLVADERNEPSYNPQMLRADTLTPGVVGVGARWSALIRSGRWPMNVVIECTEYQRPSLLGSTTILPTMEIAGRLTFEPVPEGTQMCWDWRLRPTGALRLISPVLGLVGRRQERRVWAGLKALLESSDVRPPASVTGADGG
jgi:hypothetical protein